MAYDHKQWLSSLKAKYPDLDVPEEAELGWMRQSDYDSKFNTLKKEHADRMATEDNFRAELLKSEAKLRLMQQLESQYGPAESWTDALTNAINVQHGTNFNSNGNGVDSGIITNLQNEIESLKTQMQQVGTQVQQVGTGAAVLIDFMTDAPAQFRDKYGKPFPKSDWQKFYNEAGIPDPRKAYELFERPFADEKQKEEFRKQIEDAEQKGYQSAMSKYGHVETPVQMQTSGMFFKGGQPQVDPATGQPVPDATAAPTYEERRARVGNAFIKALDDANKGKAPSS